MNAPPPLLPVVPGTAPLCVAFSGGLDSTVLLHLLAGHAETRARGLRALHVDHGLHRESADWARHCRDTCAAWDVPLQVERGTVETNTGQGPEAAARAARHAAFARLLGEGEVLVLAHHRDDQAETFLLRALRASGVDGLGAMRAWRPFGQGWLARPLLQVPRAALVEHARLHDLKWIEDPSNAAVDFDRNFLRHRVLPLLRERWPQLDAGFARSAALCAESAELLDDGDAEVLADSCTDDSVVLSQQALLDVPAARRARVLRRWIADLGLPPLPANGVSRIEAEVLGASADAVAEFAWSGASIRAWRGQLHAIRQAAPLPPDWQVSWDGLSDLALPTGDTLRLEPAIGFGTRHLVRARQGGERIRLPGRDHSHSLKHILQALGLPPWERERLPLLVTPEGELLAAGDLASSAAFDQWLRDSGARLAWQRAPRR